MRWLLRYVLFWLIVGPLLYLFGLPILLDYLSKKSQVEAYDQCQTYLGKEGVNAASASPISPDRAEKYCHCVSDGLILTKNDVFDLVHHRPAAALNTLAQDKADTCNTALMHELSAPAPQAAPDASGLIHL